ncbi:MAG: hypothetical protein MHMPM18_004232, partial [Marteilia pararefringens]
SCVLILTVTPAFDPKDGLLNIVYALNYNPIVCQLPFADFNIKDILQNHCFFSSTEGFTKKVPLHILPQLYLATLIVLLYLNFAEFDDDHLFYIVCEWLIRIGLVIALCFFAYKTTGDYILQPKFIDCELPIYRQQKMNSSSRINTTYRCVNLYSIHGKMMAQIARGLTTMACALLLIETFLCVVDVRKNMG